MHATIPVRACLHDGVRVEGRQKKARCSHAHTIATAVALAWACIDMICANHCINGWHSRCVKSWNASKTQQRIPMESLWVSQRDLHINRNIAHSCVCEWLLAFIPHKKHCTRLDPDAFCNVWIINQISGFDSASLCLNSLPLARRSQGFGEACSWFY